MQAVHFSADQKLLDFIEKKLNKLDHYFGKITDVNVTLKLENAGQIKDKIAEIRLGVPGGFVIVRETCKTFETAIDRAIPLLKRQLIKFKEVKSQN
ncbi:MAG: ribosome-associated translation inhibitor RaiA, partial [Saprospiraceae bacterium]